MTDLESLLTDEFVLFSNKISEIHTALKSKNENIKKLLDAYKEEKAKLEAEARQLLASWEARKKDAPKK